MKPDPVYYDQANSLDARTVHEVALYDPAAHDDQIVVMFETRDDARAALEKLAAEALAGDARITARTPDGANAGVNSEGGNTGLLGALKGLFAPDDEVHGLAEGVNRGHALLVLHPALDTRLRVIEILEASHPIDFDARLEQWRTAGWQNLHAARASAAQPGAVEPGVPQPGMAQPGAPQAGTERVRAGTRDTTRGGDRVRSYYAPRS